MIPEKKLNFIIRKIESNCDCKGDGCQTCRQKTARITLYAKSGIPVEYWNKSWKDFAGDQNFKKIVRDKILSRMVDVYDNGESFAFVGKLGVGKTYAACAILKIAALNDFSIHYCNMSDVIDKVTKNDHEYFDILINKDFVCFDEFDSRWIYPSEKAEQLFGQTMERIFRHRFQNNMPTVVCSNTIDIESVLKNDFENSIDSLFTKFMKIIDVGGKDYRKYGKE
jgi:DNA replication protein DnaC